MLVQHTEIQLVRPPIAVGRAPRGSGLVHGPREGTFALVLVVGVTHGYGTFNGLHFRAQIYAPFPRRSYVRRLLGMPSLGMVGATKYNAEFRQIVQYNPIANPVFFPVNQPFPLGTVFYPKWSSKVLYWRLSSATGFSGLADLQDFFRRLIRKNFTYSSK
jgi:hypothetical protein